MRRRNTLWLILFLLGMSGFAINFMAGLLIRQIPMPFLDVVGSAGFLAGIILTAISIEGFLLSNYIYKGFRYFWRYLTICIQLEKQLVDAGLCIDRGNYLEIPYFTLSFSKDLDTGILRVRNSLKFDKKLDDVVMSAALGRYAVERHYQTDNGNFYVYELIDASITHKMTFHSLNEFKCYNAALDTYTLSLDRRTQVKLQHTLLVGQTGSGKTYALYYLILQMLFRDINNHLFFADPKGSSIAVLGEVIAPERTAVSVEDIIELLESFVEAMRERKAVLKDRLKERLDADYRNFKLEPYVFLFDEYASFASVLASEDKKTRDSVRALLYEIILQGRQLGFFIIIAMQKSDATLIDTALRDNLPLKIVLGNAEQYTYITAFGNGVDIPNRDYPVGEGVFTEPSIAPQPKLVQFPLLDFDILEACRLLAWVM